MAANVVNIDKEESDMYLQDTTRLVLMLYVMHSQILS